jgi:predicted cupin superfamily sugar epimerase
MPHTKSDFIHQLIQQLKLQPLPVEGGLYALSYTSSESIPSSALPGRYHSTRPMGTAIYYLLTDDPDSFSAVHRLATDEIYHFYLGDPVEMLLLFPGGTHQVVTLGQDLPGGQQVQFVVPHGAWQGSHLLPGGSFALLGTSMAPGYAAEDFELGARGQLLQDYPGAAALIQRLTRRE